MQYRLILGLVATLLTGFAQAGILYLNDGDDNYAGGTSMYAVDTATGQVIHSWAGATNRRTFPIAVHGDIRTTGYSASEVGAQFSLNGVHTGTLYTGHGMYRTLSDGTTDGQYNYGSSWLSGEIFQFDRDWQNGTLLFDAGVTAGGVTYNPNDDTFWVSQDRTRSSEGIRQFSRNGTLLNSFSIAEVGQADWNLAFDPTDSTLWISTFRTNRFHQYALDGTYLGLTAIAGLDPARSFFSAEFNLGAAPVINANPVSEPGVLVTLGLGLLGMIWLRRRQRAG